MEEPTEAQLVGAFRRLLDVVVARDTRATRREAQLRELTHVLLVKLDSDATGTFEGENASVEFAVRGSEADRVSVTAAHVRSLFQDLFARRRDTIFAQDDVPEIRLDDATIYQAVVELSRFRLLFIGADVISKAFQVLRTKVLKSGEGQFLTPQQVIRSCVIALDVQPGDKVIDPACGTGGFVFEVMDQLRPALRPPVPQEAGVRRPALDKVGQRAVLRRRQRRHRRQAHADPHALARRWVDPHVHRRLYPV